VNKEKKQFFITTILVVLFLVLAWKNIMVPQMRSQKETERTQGVVQQSMAKTVAPLSGVRARAEQRRIQDDQTLAWGRNPFQRMESGSAPVFELQGILWDAEHPLAMINGEAYGVGDKIDSARVKHIDKSRVVLESDIETIELDLSEGF